MPAPSFRYAFAGMVAMAAAMGIGRFVYTPILPGMMAALGLSASDAGLIASANYLGYLVGALACAGGWAAGRERPLMLAGLAASTLFLVGMGFSDGMPAFLVLRFLGGIASAFLMVFLASVVFSHLAAAGRNDLQALHFGGVGVGIAISAAMIAGLYIAGYGWQAGWLTAALISAVAFAVVAVLIRTGPYGSGPAAPEPPLPKDTALTKLIVAYGLFGAGYVVTATFIVAIVREGAGGPIFEATVWLVTGLAGAVSVWLWAKAVPRIGLAATFAVGCIVEAVGVAASVAGGDFVGPLLGGTLLGGTFIAVTAFGLQAGRLLAGRSPRRAFALMTASFGLGQILGPIAAGYAADLTGSFVAPSIGAAAVLLLTALIAWQADGAVRAATQ